MHTITALPRTRILSVGSSVGGYSVARPNTGLPDTLGTLSLLLGREEYIHGIFEQNRVSRRRSGCKRNERSRGEGGNGKLGIKMSFVEVDFQLPEHDVNPEEQNKKDVASYEYYGETECEN